MSQINLYRLHGAFGNMGTHCCSAFRCNASGKRTRIPYAGDPEPTYVQHIFIGARNCGYDGEAEPLPLVLVPGYDAGAGFYFSVLSEVVSFPSVAAASAARWLRCPPPNQLPACFPDAPISTFARDTAPNAFGSNESASNTARPALSSPLSRGTAGPPRVRRVWRRPPGPRPVVPPEIRRQDARGGRGVLHRRYRGTQRRAHSAQPRAHRHVRSPRRAQHLSPRPCTPFSSPTFPQEWRKAQGLDKFILMGHSFGGYVAGCYALAHQERVRRLILVGSAGVEEVNASCFGPNGQPWGLEGIPLEAFKALWHSMQPQILVRMAGPLGPLMASDYVQKKFGPKSIGGAPPLPPLPACLPHDGLAQPPATGRTTFARTTSARKFALVLAWTDLASARRSTSLA